MQEQSLLKWESYIQHFLNIIKYKKGIINKLEDLLSRPPT